MFTYNSRDAHRNLTPSRVHLPPKGKIVEILPERIKTDDDEADPALLRLPAPGLRGTWSRAYALLTRLVSQIGWDELLKTRSSVFVMEEEYRMQKAQTEQAPATASSTIIHEDGTVVSPKRGVSLQGKAAADDDASTRGVVSPAHSTPDEDHDEPKGDGDSETLVAANGIPTIRISTESAREAAKENGNAEVESAKENGIHDAAGDSLEKPVQAAEKAENQDDGGQSPSQEPFSFSNKRLCERWLDNLFMVLYEVSVLAPMFLVQVTKLLYDSL